MATTTLVSLIPLLPALGAVVIGLLVLLAAGKAEGPNKTLVSIVAVAGPALAFCLALKLFGIVADDPTPIRATPWTWFAVGDLQVPMSFVVDRLSSVMLLVITGIGSLIHLYSVGYMGHERGFARFFAYLNLFTASMLILVLGANVPVMFLGWEGVGVCSYLLIGYYFHDVPKAQAANKAFIVNRIGDWGLLLGLFTLFFFAGAQGVWSLDFATLAEKHEIFKAAPAMAVVIGLLFFVGASGKSAQFPLHVWLADAMAGPTPVSALIHAATMVTAGVYMVARMGFLFEHAPAAGAIISMVGAFTAIMAASIALTQRNIKKVLAYSTVSQLGYMFMAVGAGAYAAGVFHLVTHAFFKAALFLGAGAVIHAMHHEEEMDRYGGLKDKLPYTWAIMGIGTLAIAGVPPLAGFFSKDGILAAAYEHGWTGIFTVGLITGGMTAFYMFRMFYLTFYGKPRDAELHAHAHEGPWVMNAPLAVLATGAVVVGIFGLPAALGGSRFSEFLAPALPKAHHSGLDAFALHSMEFSLMGMAVVAAGVGILIATLRYVVWQRADFSPRSGLAALLDRKYYLDEINDALFVKPSIHLLGWGAWRVVDRQVIDGAVRAVPAAIRWAAQGVRPLQMGRTRGYAYVMLGGTLAIVLWVMSHYALLRL